MLLEKTQLKFFGYVLYSLICEVTETLYYTNLLL
jgi:hypothetical protein